MVNIKNCFSIGYRCNTDELMKSLNIRKYSGPFSYMICDLETCLDFINSSFVDFINVFPVLQKDHQYKWTTNIWNHDLYFNQKFVPQDENTPIQAIKRMCCWNHHNLKDPATVNSIHRRTKRLLDAIKDNNTLLLHIGNLETYNTSNYEQYYNREMLLKFISDKINVYMCLLIPLINFPFSPFLYKLNKQINIIFYKSNNGKFTNDIDDTTINWEEIKNIINQLYEFNL